MSANQTRDALIPMPESPATALARMLAAHGVSAAIGPDRTEALYLAILDRFLLVDRTDADA